MGREQNITVCRGHRRFAVAIRKPVAILKAPLRPVELEAIRPGRGIAPIDQANSEPEVCLTAPALRAPLLRFTFRQLGPRNLSVKRSPISTLSEVSAAHVHSVKSVNQGPKAAVPQNRPTS
jgi:hypothetical protein